MKNKGRLHAYKAHFSKFGVHFENSPADLSLLEEIGLARNRIQHQDHIAQQLPTYGRSDLKKLPSPIFINELERGFLPEWDTSWFSQPTVHITADNFLAAIEQVEKFSDWFEDEMIKLWPRRLAPPASKESS